MHSDAELDTRLQLISSLVRRREAVVELQARGGPDASGQAHAVRHTYVALQVLHRLVQIVHCIQKIQLKKNRNCRLKLNRL